MGQYNAPDKNFPWSAMATTTTFITYITTFMYHGIPTVVFNDSM